MTGWVKGPIPLTERAVNVYEGTVAVVLRNGALYDVRGPGRNGGLLRLFSESRRMPTTGTLEILTFERAPDMSQPVSTDVRLRDGATVTVTCRAAIVPLWEKDLEAVKTVVRRYGVQPERIEAAAQLDLEESLRVMAVSSLNGLTHEEVHQQPDARRLMRLPAPHGLLTVERLLSCSVSRDRHEEGTVATRRDAALDGLTVALQGKLEALRATNQVQIDAITRRGELAGRRETALVDAEINSMVAKILGISAVDVAYPDQRDARLRAQYETVRAVLQDNMDLLPLLSEPGFERSIGGLTSMMSGLFTAGEPNGVIRDLGRAPAEPAKRPLGIESRTRLIRKASAQGPSGPLEVLLLDGGTDRVVGSIREPGPHRVLIRQDADAVDVSMRALAGAATWCGVRVGAKVVVPVGSAGSAEVALTRVETTPSSDTVNVEAALGAWIAAINFLLAGAVTVSVAA